MDRARAIGIVLALAASTSTGRAADGPASWSAEPAASRVVVHVYKKGLLSGMAHDHHFVAGDLRASATTGPAGLPPIRFEVVIGAASLRDGAPDLSPTDRAKVDAQAAGEDVLDAARHPEIRFTSREPAPPWPPPGPDGTSAGELRGVLSLHGRERALAVPVRVAPDGAALRVRGSVRLLQSDFGIEPYSGFLGMVAVEDEIQVDLDLRMVPTP